MKLTIPEVLELKVVSLDLLKKIQIMSKTNLDMSKIIIDLEQEKLYYINETQEYDEILFELTDKENEPYNVYLVQNNQQSIGAQSTSNTKKKILIKDSTTQAQQSDVKYIPVPVDYRPNSKAAFAKIGILLTVSILAAFLLSSLILLFK